MYGPRLKAKRTAEVLEKFSLELVQFLWYSSDLKGLVLSKVGTK